MNFINRILLIASLALTGIPGFADTGIYNVRDYGASGKKTDNATPAVQKAIDAARSNGGGTVVIPAGEYRSTALTLYSDITLQIDGGAVLYADLSNPDFKGPAFIYAEKAKRIMIRGKGKIDGQASYVYEELRGEDPSIKEEIALAKAAGVEMKRYYRSPGKAAFNLLMSECEDLTIEDITLVNSSLWCIRIWGGDRVTIRDVTLFSSLEKGVNSDGIDIDGSRNVHISGCNISVGDDAICIKSGLSGRNGTATIKTSENIIVDNCVLSSSSAALKLGTESYGDMRHIIFTNCVIRNSNKGIEINVQDGANVSDIIFSNLTMGLQRRHWNWWGDAQVFNFLLKKRNDSSKAGSISNIQVSNVIAYAQGTSKIHSDIKNGIRNFTISNLKIFMEQESTKDKRTSSAMRFINMSQLKLKDIEIYWNEEKTEPKWKSALALENIKGFKLEGINVRQAFVHSSEPAISIHNCVDGILFNCLAQPSTNTFFKITGELTSNLDFGKNYLKNAVSPVVISKEVKKQKIFLNDH